MNIINVVLLICIYALFILWILLTFINLWYKSKLGGKVILNIKRGSEKKLMILTALIIIFASIISNTHYEIIEIIIGIVILYNGMEKFEIMENGIFIEGNFKKWEDIEKCNKYKKADSTLIIKGKEDVSFLRRFDIIKLKLKKEEEDKVFTLISRMIN